MNTVDFLPASAFESFLERRRTPRRALIVGAYALLCAAGAVALRWEASAQERAAVLAEAPNAEETAAGAELRQIYGGMSAYADRLDPLAGHLRLPVAGPLLANLGAAVGEFVRVEEISLEHMVGRKGEKIEHAELHVRVLALVHGDRNLIELPERLREHAGVQHARTASSELVLEMRDTMRTEIQLVGPLMLPGMTEPKIRPESLK
jgi:hypothetical protein